MKGRLDELISKDQKKNFKKKPKRAVKQKFSSYHVFDPTPLNPTTTKKKKTKKEIKKFRKGLNLNNFAEKTHILFKNKIVAKKEFVFDNSRQNEIYRKNDHRFNSILLDPNIWREKLKDVFRELNKKSVN